MIKYESWKEMDKEIRRITRRDKVRTTSKDSKDEYGYPVKVFSLTTKDGITYEYTMRTRIVDHPWFDEKVPDGYLFERNEVTLNEENQHGGREDPVTHIN